VLDIDAALDGGAVFQLAIQNVNGSRFRSNLVIRLEYHPKPHTTPGSSKEWRMSVTLLGCGRLATCMDRISGAV
jgi:hypothetical protein